jgi:predicted outer membrane repeat protein
MAIYNTGTSTITNSTFTGNKASMAYASVLYNMGEVTITGSTITGNISLTHGAILSTGTLNIGSGNKFYGNSGGGNGGAIYSTGTLNLADTGMIYGNFATIGKDVCIGSAINYTGETLSEVQKGYEMSVSYGSGYAATGAIAAITTSNENAAKVASGIVVENGNKVAAEGNNVVFTDSGYQVTINPNGGVITYTTGTGENAVISEPTENAITLYAAKDSKKLYTTKELTTEVTSITLIRNGYTSTGIYSASTDGVQYIVKNSCELAHPYTDSSASTLFAQ